MSDARKLLEINYTHIKTIQDSVQVTDAEIKVVMEEKLNFILGKIGSMDKVVEYYKKDF
jgi:peptidyl-prolyl cis-trans isomerase SurA